jgi:hypothetical protein
MVKMMEDCEHHGEDEVWESCNYRGGVCRFKHRKNCSDYKPIVFEVESLRAKQAKEESSRGQRSEV